MRDTEIISDSVMLLSQFFNGLLMLKLTTYFSALGLAFILLFSACQQALIDPDLGQAKELKLTLSQTELTLEERLLDNRLNFSWTTGSNQGTGAAIFYTLEIDRAGSDFAEPLLRLVEGEPARFSYSLDHGTLNQRLLEAGLVANERHELMARVQATFTTHEVALQVAEVPFSVTLFQPVSTQLFLFGSATAAGWDIGQAIEMEASRSRRRTFTYAGQLSPGTFKFAVNREGCFCQDFYTRDPDDPTRIVYNQGGSGADLQWEITETGNYSLTVDLLSQTIEIRSGIAPPYSDLYLVGDASPSGWNIGSPQAFTQSSQDPFVFTFEGSLSAGEFKISTFTGDWCDGDWLNAANPDQSVSNSSFIITQACDGPDNKWRVQPGQEGNYRITVDFNDYSMDIEQ